MVVPRRRTFYTSESIKKSLSTLQLLQYCVQFLGGLRLSDALSIEAVLGGREGPVDKASLLVIGTEAGVGSEGQRVL